MSISDCTRIDRFVTPYVDGGLSKTESALVEGHLQQCEACRARVLTETSVRDLVRARRPALLSSGRASGALRARVTDVVAAVHSTAGPMPAISWRSRVAPYAVAAALVLIVGGAFLYQATQMSTRVMAAELAADHVKCFLMNDVLGTSHTSGDVEEAMASSFGWKVHLPTYPGEAGLELVGSRPCLYGQGRVAHLMYRHEGHPVSVFMLPNTVKAEESVTVLGHETAIWSEGGRTFVLVAREPPNQVQRMVSFVHGSLR